MFLLKSKKTFSQIFGSACLLLFSVGLVPSAPAAEVSLLPSIGITAEYNDNIDFSRTYEEDDYLTRIRPALDLDYKTDLLSLKGRGAVTVIRYLDATRRNTEYYDFGFDGAYKVTERLSAEARVSYRKDETLESELEETGLVTFPEDRTRYTAGGGVVYALTERSELGVDFDHNDTNYDSASDVDYTYDSLALTFNHLLDNMKDVLTVKTGFSAYDSDASETDSYSLYLGLAHPFSETWSLSCFLGARYTSTDYFFIQQGLVYDPSLLPGYPFRRVYQQVEETDRGWGGLADISLTKTGEDYSGTVGFNHDLSYSSQGDPIDRDRLYFRATKRMTRRLSMGLTGSAYITQSSGKFDQEDSRHLDLGTSLTYRLTETYSLSAAYGYSYHKDKTVSENQGYDRNRVWLNLLCRFPKKW